MRGGEAKMIKIMVVGPGELERARGEEGSVTTKRIVASLVLAFALGLFLSCASFAGNRVFVYCTQEDSSLPSESARKVSFYSYAIPTEKTVKVFGFYVGPISPNGKRINLILSEEGKLQVQEAECASSYKNEPFCAPMLFLPEEWVQAPRAERVIPGKTVSFFRGDSRGVIFDSTLTYLNYEDFVLATVSKAYLAELKEAVYTTVSPQKWAELEVLRDEINRPSKDVSQDYGLPEKPKPNTKSYTKPNIWGIKWDKIATDPEKLFMSFKNQNVADLQNFFKWGSLLNKFPGKPFSITVYLSMFGSDGQVDYEPILEIPLFEIHDLNIIPKQVEKNFGVSNVVR